MTLVIDNYDSFTYNLVQYMGQLGEEIMVRRNDEVTVDEVEAMNPARLVISPGPGRPEKAGISVEAIRRFGSRVPILGVCLGHQAIGVAFGGMVVRNRQLRHGKCSTINHDGRGIFRDLTGGFSATRYHSLVVSDENLPESLEVAARATDDGSIMAVRHISWPIHGVQFHPESILTTMGLRIVQSFLEL